MSAKKKVSASARPAKTVASAPALKKAAPAKTPPPAPAAKAPAKKTAVPEKAKPASVIKKPAPVKKTAAKKVAKAPAPAAAKEKITSVVKTAAKVAVKKAAVKKAVVSPKTSAPAPAKKAAPPAPKKTVAIPALLLEGDAPSAPAPSGPGQRYALGPTAPAEHFVSLGELPDAYGSKKIWLVARDPHWLYAHWDLTREQLRRYNGLAASGHLTLRVYQNSVAGKPFAQVEVHPESRNWFIHVGRGGQRFAAELGYYAEGGRWVQIAVSPATLTPPDALAEDTSVRFATIPVDVPFATLVQAVKTVVTQHQPLAEAILELARTTPAVSPSAPASAVATLLAVLRTQTAAANWTPAQEQALAEVVTMDTVRRVWVGSLEITELVRRQLVRDVASAAAAQFSLPSSLSLGSPTSPFGGAAQPPAKDFWFNVNAELIIYGATLPDATVTIGGRKIQLRPDGSFSYRFALPDGNYELPARATAADGADAREARLRFQRQTGYQGEVGTHPQDAALRPPKPENVG